MKIAVCSDLHLEFGNIELQNTDNADVLVLSGDICIAADSSPICSMMLTKAQMIHTFFERCTTRFKHVIYVLGNHEHYHGDFVTSSKILKENLSYFHNLHILDKETVTIDGITFVGCTLWTNLKNRDPLVMHSIKYDMNDYAQIKNSTEKVYYKTLKDPNDPNSKKVFRTRIGKLTPNDTCDEHEKCLAFIKESVESSPNGKFVVVGHHAPSRRSQEQMYAREFMRNYAYYSDLDMFIIDHPQIVLWTHGHMHTQNDYEIGNTRIFSNPRGYIGYEECAEHFELKSVEI